MKWTVDNIEKITEDIKERYSDDVKLLEFTDMVKKMTSAIASIKWAVVQPDVGRLPDDFIILTKDFLDYDSWYTISKNIEFYSDEFKWALIDKIDWRLAIYYDCSAVPLGIIERVADQLNQESWDCISCDHSGLDAEFIVKYNNRIDFVLLCSNTQVMETLPEEVIKKFISRFDWNYIQTATTLLDRRSDELITELMLKGLIN